MARALLAEMPMAQDSDRWVALSFEGLLGIPEAGGVFEVANLVRTVVYIGRAHGNLRQTLDRLLGPPSQLPASAGGYYVRWAITEREAEVLEQRLADFRRQHGDTLPQCHGERPRPALIIASQHAAA